MSVSVNEEGCGLWAVATAKATICIRLSSSVAGLPSTVIATLNLGPWAGGLVLWVFPIYKLFIMRGGLGC